MNEISLRRFNEILRKEIASSCGFRNILIYELVPGKIGVSFFSNNSQNRALICDANFDSVFHLFDEFDYDIIYCHDSSGTYSINLVINNLIFIEIKYLFSSGQQWLYEFHKKK